VILGETGRSEVGSQELLLFFSQLDSHKLNKSLLERRIYPLTPQTRSPAVYNNVYMPVAEFS
jgi:hypothetical protein